LYWVGTLSYEWPRRSGHAAELEPGPSAPYTEISHENARAHSLRRGPRVCHRRRRTAVDRARMLRGHVGDRGTASRAGHSAPHSSCAEVRQLVGQSAAGWAADEGIDIFAPADTPVLSTTRGIVTRVGTNRLGGQVVWVLGPGLERHYYAHLSRYGDVREGDRVEAGDVIGYTGNTGNARGGPAHLHYGIYGHAGARNPYSRLVAGSEPARVATRTNPPRHRFSAP
jgi:murein DD-endopeptidase MepM/ murein hydrolase activator NlpD